ncbi:hypothetical protein ACP4OV_004409 [Aristida adscensionis]
MFRSKGPLSEKGALGLVWAVAVRQKKLSLEQVVGTDIAAAVDFVVDESFLCSTNYGILGFLLFGIVRIYSMKMDYVYRDSKQIFQSIEQGRCAEPSTPAGRSMRGVLKQAKKAVRARRVVGGQPDSTEAKKNVYTVRITDTSGLVSSGGVTREETGVIVHKPVEVQEALVTDDPPTFTVPKGFELDSFDLGIDENRDDDDGGDHHQASHKDILLDDGHRYASHSYEFYKNGSYALESLDSACFMSDYIALPSEVISAVTDILDLSTNGDELRESRNSDSACFTPVRDVLPPELMGMRDEASSPSNKHKRGDKSGTEVNTDENTGSPYFCTLPGIREGQSSENVPEDVNCPSLNARDPTTEESENGLLLEKPNTVPPVAEFPDYDTQDHQPLEPPTLSCKTGAANELSPSTPEPLLEGVPAPPSSRGFRVRTPAKNEKRWVTRKRRAVHNMDYLPTDRENIRRVRRRLTWLPFDKDIILSNEVMRKMIKLKPDDLIGQRRKVPLTRLDIWKLERINSLPDSFMDPLIPCSTSIHPSCITIPDALESSCAGSVKRRVHLSDKPFEPNFSCNDVGNTEQQEFPDEPRNMKLGELTDIQAHFDHYNESEHVQNDVCEHVHDTVIKEKSTIQVRGDDPTSTGLSKEVPHESENNILFHCETLDDLGEDVPMDDKHIRDEGGSVSSTRTRRIAKCFHQLFLSQKCKQESGVLTLSQALDGRMRKTSARFFYETLVLKSHGFIQVKQEQPYGDITVSGTQKLEEAFQSGGD